MNWTDRFWSKVDRSGGPGVCWPWLGYRNAKGYGRFRDGTGRELPAHLYAWKQFNGSLPTGKPCGLHTCDNPPCCNYRHVFPGTKAENNADMKAKGRLNVVGLRARQQARSKQEYCLRGHDLTQPESYYVNDKGHRRCKACVAVQPRYPQKPNGQRQHRKTHCKRGHVLLPGFDCRVCKTDRQRGKRTAERALAEVAR